jgi:hypothetical protein
VGFSSNTSVGLSISPFHTGTAGFLVFLSTIAESAVFKPCLHVKLISAKDFVSLADAL